MANGLDTINSMASNPPPEATLRVGIVGCGRATETLHLPALRHVGRGVDVLAVADVDEHRRRRVSGMFDIPRAFPDIGAMLEDVGASLDAVAVFTPATFHVGPVLAAMAAGKHVLVEKPLALTLEEADQIVAAADAAPRLKLMLGFNLRHHRLVRRAKQMITAGLLGDIQLVRTTWTTDIRWLTKLPAWRNSRLMGGGTLSELAVHHVDLLRYLTGSEVEEVFATSRHGEGDDESAAVTFRLTSGAAVSSVFSERTAAANELELFGSKGRLSFSIYQFDSFTFTPICTSGGRARHLMQTLKDIPEVWPILRRGGDFRDTYRREWLAFIEAVHGDHPVTATAADGRAALRVILTAGLSANTGKPVAIADAPRQPQPVTPPSPSRGTPLSPSPGTPGEGRGEGLRPLSPVDRPQLSAIIATRHSFDSIRRTIRYLRAQTVQDRIELVILCPNETDLALDPDEIQGFWGHRIVAVGSFDAGVRAAGVRAAAAPLVVLCEDHAFPDPDWAAALIAAHRGPYAAVGPAVHNANPDTTVSWADCLIGYGPWLEPIRPCEPSHLPGHNSCYKRAVLLEYGPRLDEMMESETVLQWDLRSKGHRLYLEPAARLAHTNFALWGVWTSVQFHAGRVFGTTRALGWPLWKRLLFTCASPLIPLVRLKRIWGQVRRIRQTNPMPAGVLPTLLWGLAMDGLGQMAGYALGAGGSSAKIAQLEFDRVRYITEQDRRQLAVRASQDAQAAAQHAELP